MPNVQTSKLNPLNKLNSINKLTTKHSTPNLVLPRVLTSIIVLASALTLAACNQQSPIETTAQTEEANSVEAIVSTESKQSITEDTNLLSDEEPVTTRDKEITIDWSRVESGEKAVARKDFDYPFQLEGESVKSQAKFSNISPKQAQHSLTVAMASNEPLDKLLDQLGDSYLSHRFSEKEAKLIVHTTPNVKPSHFDYVIAHEFARGLVLPIEVVPQTATESATQSATKPETQAANNNSEIKDAKTSAAQSTVTGESDINSKVTSQPPSN